MGMKRLYHRDDRVRKLRYISQASHEESSVGKLG